MSGSAGVISNQAANPANPAPLTAIRSIAWAGTILARWTPNKSVKEELAVAADETTVRELEKAAMDIWLRDLPDINLAQFYNRTGNNAYYWTNWPSTDTDPYMNGIHMHTGFPYTTLQLKATDAP